MIVSKKEELKKIITEFQQSGKRVLVKKGVFDIIHPGHIYAIDMFSKEADVVVILLQSDEFTRMKKGETRPINTQSQRAQVIDGIKGVDYVFQDKSNSREEYIEFLEYLRPDIIAVTSVDPKKTAAYSRTYWQLKEFPDKDKPGFSTTEIINRVLENYK